MMKTLLKTIVFFLAISCISDRTSAQMFAERIEGDYVISYTLNQINQYISTMEPDLRGQALYDRLAYERFFLRGDSILVNFTITGNNELEDVARMNRQGANFHQVLDGDIYYAGFVQIDSLLRFLTRFPHTTIKMELEHVLPTNDDEGPERTNSITYETGILNPNAGSGISIAILDSDWTSYTFSMNNGLVPSAFAYYDCSSGTCILTTIPGGNTGCTTWNGCVGHGTMTAQTVFDHAPAATYRIYNTPSNSARAAAIQHAANLNVNIITCSQSGYNTGWNDNTGVICSAVNASGANGVLMFFSAGNRNGTATINGSHWQGNFNDNGSGFHRWAGTDIVNNRTTSVAPDDGFHVYIQCDNDGGIFSVYEVQIINTANNNVLANSSFTQSRFLSWTNSTSNNINVGIRLRALTPFRPQFEMWTHNEGQYQYFSTTNQTSSPGNCTSNPRLLTVAAVEQANYHQSNPSAMWYSSSGPSNNSNNSVALSGPTNTTVARFSSTGTQFTGSYGGTSAATPNIAGTAAAFWSKHSGLNATHVRNILIFKAFNYKNWGASGYDDQFGWGGTYLFSYNPANIYMHQISGNSGIAPANGVYPWYSLKDIHNMAPNNRHVIMLTHDTETVPFIISKNMFINAAGDPGTNKRIE